MEYQKLPLNGNWELEPGIERPDKFTYQVTVPALVDMTSPGLDWQNYDYFWYRTRFYLPEIETNYRVFVQLEQVKYGTEVWLNDQKVGGDIPCYTSQEFDLTPFIVSGKENLLLVRVGAKHTLPSHSAVGNDFEKTVWIPGIWGDVWLHLYGAGRVQWTRIIADIEEGKIALLSEINNLSARGKSFTLQYRVWEKQSQEMIATSPPLAINTRAHSTTNIQSEIPLGDFTLWSPENPFLYTLEVTLRDGSSISHSRNLNFGMRNFEIRGKHFFLNGQRRVLFGSNIAFHRMLSDPTRGILPWDATWIKKALVDIPKAYNLFFFRFHIGHAYNRWYDMADEHGIMLQDEWMFWTSTGTPEQIETEFRAWIRENAHHPSIVIWDALNESEDATITEEIIPRLKQLDPTRPWEPVDFHEDHPYIYSLGPVLNSSRMGYSRSISDLQKSPTPTMVNEYSWWWLDSHMNPTNLTRIVMERWVGPNPTKQQLLNHQSFLVTELSELWRRLGIDAIMPFVYLSNNNGPTANWFDSSLNELHPKPILSALKNVLSPVAVSVELWDRHFLTGETREVSLYLFNDSASLQTVALQIYFDHQPDKIMFEKKLELSTWSAGNQKEEHRKLAVNINYPSQSGATFLVARLLDENEAEIARSQKSIITFDPLVLPSPADLPSISLHDPNGEIEQFLRNYSVKANRFPVGIENAQLVFINTQGLNDFYRKSLDKLTQFVNNGGILIVQEPEFGVEDTANFPLLENLYLNVKYRIDPDLGGYDSYVFPEDKNHFLWRNIEQEHLQMFNGAFGGEMVSQHNVWPTLPYNPVGRCHLYLRVPAVLEIPYGDGWIIISRLQIRGRLLQQESSADLFGRRYDPVAEQYFWNLITGYISQVDYHRKIQKSLAIQKIYVAHMRSSPDQIYYVENQKISTRWESTIGDQQWIWIDLGQATSLQKVILRWQTAGEKEYEVLTSRDNKNWEPIASKADSENDRTEILTDHSEFRYLHINFTEHATQWGYSTLEIELQ